MPDLKFIGISVPSSLVQRQADPDNDSLLLSNYRPSGGGIPMLIEPVASSVGASQQLLSLLDGPGGSSVLDITRNGVGTAFVSTLSGDVSVTGNLTCLGGAIFGNDASDSFIFAKSWTHNAVDFSYIEAATLDPNDLPVYGANGSASLYLGTGTSSPAVTGFSANAGSLLLNVDGTAWVKTGVGDTAWGQLATVGLVSQQTAYDQGQVIATDLNGTNAPLRITYNSGAANTHSLLLVDRSPSASGVGRGIEVAMGANANGVGAEGVSVSHSGASSAIAVANSGGGTGVAITQSVVDSSCLSATKNLGISPALDVIVATASNANGLDVSLGTGTGHGVAVTMTGGGGDALNVSLTAGDVGLRVTDPNNTLEVRADQLLFTELLSDITTPSANSVGLYSKDIGGISSLAARTDDGTIHELTNRAPKTSISSISAGPHTAAAEERVLYDPSGGTFQINAPAGPATGDRFSIKNITTDATAVTISGNGANIEDPNTSTFLASFSLAGGLVAVDFLFAGTNWVII